LIQWSEQPDPLATWEDITELQQRFPHAAAWGQAAFQEGGSVSDPPGVLTNRAQDGEEVQPIKRTRRPSTHYATQEWTT
jgi:hypothetical protein